MNNLRLFALIFNVTVFTAILFQYAWAFYCPGSGAKTTMFATFKTDPSRVHELHELRGLSLLTDGTGSICSGFLVAPCVVFTAAYCQGLKEFHLGYTQHSPIIKNGVQNSTNDQKSTQLMDNLRGNYSTTRDFSSDWMFLTSSDGIAQLAYILTPLKLMLSPTKICFF